MPCAHRRPRRRAGWPLLAAASLVVTIGGCHDSLAPKAPRSTAPQLLIVEPPAAPMPGERWGDSIVFALSSGESTFRQYPLLRREEGPDSLLIQVTGGAWVGMQFIPASEIVRPVVRSVYWRASDGKIYRTPLGAYFEQATLLLPDSTIRLTTDPPQVLSQNTDSLWLLYTRASDLTALTLTTHANRFHSFVCNAGDPTCPPEARGAPLSASGPSVSMSFHVYQSSAGGAPSGELTLTCPDTTTRGSDVECVVSAATPGVSLSVTAWHFRPDNPALGTDITPPEGVELTTKWPGKMAASGTVQVTARVAGQEQEDTATAHITVEARNWESEPVAWTWNDVSPGGLSERPEKFEGELGRSGFTPAINGSAIAVIPEGGPNAGLVYFSAPPGRVVAEGAVNTTALKEGSVFYKAQPVMRNSNVIGGVKQCTRADVERIIPLVWLHEGTSAREPKSHVDTFLREYERMNRVHGEGLVSAGDFDLQAVLKAWADTAKAFSTRMTDTLANPIDGKLRCEFNFTYPPGAKK